jgi:ferredoxin-NADP reductase
MNTTPATSVLGRLTGLTDLFASPLRTSNYLELVNPMWATHQLKARVVSVWDETASARTLTLRPNRRWRTHRAGQYVRLAVAVGGMKHTRTYSISSPPERDDDCITITVKSVPGGRVSNHLVRNVEPGTLLDIEQPQGDFVLPDAVPTAPLFITAGSGITPVMSMLRSFAARGRLPSIAHLHYAPHRYDVIFGNELERLAAEHPGYRLTVVHTRELGETGSRRRHFTARQLQEACPDWASREVYACGPQGLLAAVEAHWQGAGLARRLHLERFHAAWAESPGDVASGQVRFARSARSVESDGRSNLLRVAEDAGLNPPHGCRMGICHSCDARLVSGCVRDLRTGALVTEPGRTIQLCINAAAGDVEIDV